MTRRKPPTPARLTALVNTLDEWSAKVRAGGYAKPPNHRKAKMTRRKPPTAVLMESGSGVVVTGTDDLTVALPLAVAAIAEHHRLNLEEVPDLETRLKAGNPHIGLCRWTPCNTATCVDGGDHSGHLETALERGPGVFPAVYWAEA